VAYHALDAETGWAYDAAATELGSAQWERDLAAEIAEAEAAPASEFVLGYQVAGHDVWARPHAVERHGEKVYEARVAFGQNSPQRRRNECPQSDRVINATPLADGQWAVMIEGLTSRLELTCWTVSAADVERVWLRLIEMHKCKPDPATASWGHDFWNAEVH
jgi:hypothetical protein